MHSFLLKNKKLLIDFPLICYWIIIFILTSVPTPKLPETGFTDKSAHLLAYFGLAVLLMLKLNYHEKKNILTRHPDFSTLIICAFYGAFDEVHQFFIPGRFMDFGDWIADVMGATIGVTIVGVTIFLERRFFGN